MAEPQRIAKLLARAGVASRREIERMIEERRIALDGVPQAGVVHDVARGGVLHATTGDGAFADGSRLRVSSTDTPARALIGTGIPFKDVSQADLYLRQLRRLMPIVSGVRRAGASSALKNRSMRSSWTRACPASRCSSWCTKPSFLASGRRSSTN